QLRLFITMMVMVLTDYMCSLLIQVTV
uniref:Uncharacterized protein n=1 Tax=Amphimedon queenslandica TaxID=400682 RepID=A0A1X7UA86_AMPQE